MTKWLLLAIWALSTCGVVSAEGPVDVKDMSCTDLQRTLRFREDCDRNLHSSNVKTLLVTGTGGSGTHSVAHYLETHFGVSLSHEDITGRDGAVAWPYAVNEKVHCARTRLKCQGYPWGPLSHNIRFRTVMHVTRCPMANIGALSSHAPVSFDFIGSMIGWKLEDPKFPKIISAALSWVLWNQFLDTYADYKFRIEDVNVTQVCILGGFGDKCNSALTGENGPMDNSSDVEEEITQEAKNQRAHATYTLSDIAELDPALASKIRVLGESYGYASCIEDCQSCDFKEPKRILDRRGEIVDNF